MIPASLLGLLLAVCLGYAGCVSRPHVLRADPDAGPGEGGTAGSLVVPLGTGGELVVIDDDDSTGGTDDDQVVSCDWVPVREFSLYWQYRTLQNL